MAFEGELFAFQRKDRSRDQLKRNEESDCGTGNLAKGVRVLHDNASVHSAQTIKAAACVCKSKIIDHPSYSSEPALSDYFLFPNLIKGLRRN
ncbi:hypothetical protein EVAR_48406_1 [Eumeta japonica]|uniref:Mariner Mos1 transposase n=1 Tax=Eumeta variegata TaxID=151549 RepID=A0A4C1XU60_EUMVA|nr:hypothetical protein EVAR_48406_1 [Eumeta japonica]